MAEPATLVLASASPSRLALLKGAGLDPVVDPAALDEGEVKASMHASGATAADVAEALAELKATRVSGRHPNAMVVGADQILECAGVWFDKPSDLEHARAHLLTLRGKAHHLHTCVCVVRDGNRIWHHRARADLTMRPFSNEFLDEYMARAGEDVLRSVGAYQLEGPGAQLFSAVDGDYFTVLGLPLLPLLDFLRDSGQLTR